MEVPRLLGLNHMEPTELTEGYLRPIILNAMKEYHSKVASSYGGEVLSPEAATELSLREHNILVVNGDYLLAYDLGSEWFSTELVLYEIYLARIGTGSTSLSELFDAIRVITKLHNAREAQLSPGSATALERLYRRHGAEATTTLMRIA